jgi:hypothetical protein
MPRTTKRAAAARPAPFTSEQVAALTAGKGNAADVAKMLEAHRQPRLARTRQAAGKGKRSPVPLTEYQIQRLATGGETPTDVAAALESSRPSPRRKA